MLDFVQRFFGKPSSSATAKERLRLVLLSDHLSLAPDVVDALKRDLVEVISRYVEVDVANCDVTFEQQDRQVAMLANIPILGMNARPTPPAPPPAPPSASSGQATPPSSFGNAAGASAATAIEIEPEITVSPAGSRRRRRRNKRAPSLGGAAPQPT